MSRRGVSPIRVTRGEVDPRDQLLRKLKQQLIAARQREKQLAIKESYLVQLIEKIRLITAEIAKTDEQGRTKLELSQRSAQQLKKQVQALRGELRAATVQLSQVEQQEAELKKLLNNKMIQIEKLKREGACQHEDNEKLVSQHYRLRAQQEETLHDIRKLNEGLKDYDARLGQINRKVLQVKAYINQIQQQNQGLTDQLMRYEHQNKGLDNDIIQKEGKIDGLQKSFADKHQEIKKRVENFIQLQHQNQKNLKEARHKQNLLRIQGQKQAQLASIIKKLQATINQKSKELTLIRTQSDQINRLNGQFRSMNEKLKQDLVHCQKHLQNLLQHNAYMHEQMENFMKEDETIVNIIRKKKLIPLNSYASLRSSRRPS